MDEQRSLGPPEKTMLIRLPRSLFVAAKIKSVNENRTMSAVVRALLWMWLSGEVELKKDEE